TVPCVSSVPFLNPALTAPSNGGWGKVNTGTETLFAHARCKKCRSCCRPVIGHTPRKLPALLQQPLASSHIKPFNYILMMRKNQEKLSISTKKLREVFDDFLYILHNEFFG
nr:hypothetical protein [Clostridia bacterium]